MPRYAILEHDFPALHWDLMLEEGASLRTWRLLLPPIPGCDVIALSLPPHRLIYLDYEGPVSGNRGYVTRWDHGHFEWISDTPRYVRCRLHGVRFIGEWEFLDDILGRGSFCAAIGTT